MSRRTAHRPAPAVVKTPAAAPRWLGPAIVALAALLIMAWSSTETGDPDAWWHLKTGQYIVQQHRLPLPDPFSYTTYLGKPAYPDEGRTRYFNLTHEWLAQTAFYLAYAAGGFAGLILFRSALITAFCGLVGLAAWRRTKGFYRSVGAVLAAATVATWFRYDRPVLVTFVCLAATLAILEYRRPLWALPPLFLLWANAHGGFIMGWALMGVYCAEALFLRLRGRPQPDDRKLWLAAVGSILVSGLNPNGFNVFPVMIAYRHSKLQSSIWEWHYPAPWPPSPFIVLLVLALATLVWARRRTRPVDWLLLAFGAASMSAARNIFLSALVAPLLIAAYFPWKRALPVAAEFLIAALLIAATAQRAASGQAFQFHAAEWKYPAGAADFLLAHHITAPIFNTYETGGYLMWRLWPMERVFIDGRALNESVHHDYQRIAMNADAVNGPTGDELLRQYGIEVIVMNGFEFPPASVYLLPAALSDPSQKEWKLVYRDQAAVIFMRHPPPDVQPLNSLEVLRSLEMQCELYVEHDGGSPCAPHLADLFARIGDRPHAQRWHAIAAEHGM